MKTKKYFIISAFALLAYSCQDEEQGGGTAYTWAGRSVWGFT